MNYQLFFEVKIVHPYADGILEYLTVRPSNSTKKLLEGSALVYKQTESGFKLFVSVKSDDAPAAFEAGEKLLFSIFSSSSDFMGFTDFSQRDEGKVMLFSNENLSNGNGDLIISEVSNPGKLNGFTEVGRIEIILDQIQSGANQEAPVYSVHFDVKSMIWKYYFITKDDTDALSVKHKDIVFQRITEETVDPVLKRLKENFTPKNLTVQAFESIEAIACQSFPRKDIQLKNDNTTIVSHLPNPVPGDGGIKIIRIN